MRQLDTLFSPRSIAVVGATEGRLKWGSIIITNIVDGGYRGKVFPVAKNRDTVYGIPAYKSLLDIPEKIDLVIITTPASTVMEILEECVRKGVGDIVLISSGFSETGDEGKAMEDEVIRYARAKSLNIVGPNTMGITNTKISLYATGSHVRAGRGGISIIAQSGNVGNQIMIWAEQENIGVGKFVGSGNEGILRCEDYLEYFSEDPDTSVILMYLEGVDNGREFLEIARRTTLKKPVIALKAGRTALGSRAAASHTGAMAGSFEIFRASMRQSGIIIAQTPTELLALSSAFDSMPLPKGNRVGVLTLGGGWGVITADECEERGLVLPPLPEDVYSAMDKMLPSFWSKGNPVDLVGQPDINIFRKSIEVMAASDAFDAIVFLGVIGSFKMGLRCTTAAQRMIDPSLKDSPEIRGIVEDMQRQFLDNIIGLIEKYDKPIYPVALVHFKEDDIIHIKEGSRYKVIVYKTPEEAVLCLERQYRYAQYLKNQERRT